LAGLQASSLWKNCSSSFGESLPSCVKDICFADPADPRSLQKCLLLFCLCYTMFRTLYKQLETLIWVFLFMVCEYVKGHGIKTSPSSHMLF
jgi:hypothetical protein